MAARTRLVTFTLIAAQVLLLLASTPTMAAPATEGEEDDLAAECRKLVQQAGTCTADIFSFLGFPLLADSENGCCDVLQSIGGRCLRELFYYSVGPLYSPLLSQMCGIPIEATSGGRQ